MTHFEYLKTLDKREFIKYLRFNKLICPPTGAQKELESCLDSSLEECCECWLIWLDKEHDEVKD